MSDLIIENGIVRSCQEKLLLTVDIPPGVKAIDNGVFSGMQNLISINFPASLNYIGDSAFQGCKKLMMTSAEMIRSGRHTTVRTRHTTQGT